MIAIIGKNCQLRAIVASRPLLMALRRAAGIAGRVSLSEREAVQIFSYDVF
jgi:hypothetical protein